VGDFISEKPFWFLLRLLY